MADHPAFKAIDRATRWLDNLLFPYVPDISRPDLVRKIIDGFLGDHWRPPSEPPSLREMIKAFRPPDADAAKRGAEYARELLNREDDQS